MDIFIIVLLAVILLVLASLLLHLYRKDGASSDNEGSFSMLLQQLNELSKTVDQKIGEGNRQVGETLRYQFKDSQELIKEITREITEVKEVGRQTASIAEQLKSLQDVLKNPKQRGVLGEYYLETLLKNTLPTGSYAMQYAFENGEIVDAAVFVKDKVIPVDSKFSLENYNRFVEENDGSEKEKLGKLFVTDLKARIQETAKYIRPEEGTMDFAFMFISIKAPASNAHATCSPEDNRTSNSLLLNSSEICFKFSFLNFLRSAGKFICLIKLVIKSFVFV